MNRPNFISTLAFLSFAIVPIDAADVLPAIGGGQVSMMMGAPMKHIGISFDGTDLAAHLDETVPTPLLRTLAESDQFNPAENWAVLEGTAHNFQHGWVPDGIWAPPAGASVWVEQQTASPGLQVYQGGRFMSEQTIRAMTFEPIFGTDNSANRWNWSGVMTHNAYAVDSPQQTEYTATYRVYMGDIQTGAELVDATTGAPQFGAADVTLSWAATVPEPGTSWMLLLGLFAMSAVRRVRR